MMRHRSEPTYPPDPPVSEFTRGSWVRVDRVHDADDRCDRCGTPATDVRTLQLWEQPDTGDTALRCGRDQCMPRPIALATEPRVARTPDAFAAWTRAFVERSLANHAARTDPTVVTAVRRDDVLQAIVIGYAGDRHLHLYDDGSLSIPSDVAMEAVTIPAAQIPAFVRALNQLLTASALVREARGE